MTNAESPSDMPVVEDVRSLWGVELRPAGCPKCKQVHLVRENQTEQLCPHCGGANLKPQPALLRRDPPEMVVPFMRKPADLTAILAGFTNGIWLHTDSFTPEAMLRRAVPVYWPMWLVDGDVTGTWKAEVGFNYEVKSSQEAYGSGGWQTQERIETRIRWEPRAGAIQRHYDNIPIYAISNFSSMSLLVGDFNLQAAVPYTPAAVGDAMIRLPDKKKDDTSLTVENAFIKASEADCYRAAAAQHARNFRLSAQYPDQNWTQLLMPLYVTFYLDDDGKPQMVFINGQSGQIGGPRLASQKKGWEMAGMVAAVGGILLILAFICMMLSVVFPPAAVFCILLGLLGFAVLLGAIVPAAWPSQWNRSQRELKVYKA